MSATSVLMWSSRVLAVTTYSHSHHVRPIYTTCTAAGMLNILLFARAVSCFLHCILIRLLILFPEETLAEYTQRCTEAYTDMFAHLPGGVKCKDLNKKREALKVQLEWYKRLNQELTVLDDEIPKDLTRLVRKLSDLVSPDIVRFSGGLG